MELHRDVFWPFAGCGTTSRSRRAIACVSSPTRRATPRSRSRRSRSSTEASTSAWLRTRRDAPRPAAHSGSPVRGHCRRLQITRICSWSTSSTCLAEGSTRSTSSTTMCRSIVFNVFGLKLSPFARISNESASASGLAAGIEQRSSVKSLVRVFSVCDWQRRGRCRTSGAAPSRESARRRAPTAPAPCPAPGPRSARPPTTGAQTSE